MMKKVIKASSRKTLSKDYIKVQLFDYLMDNDFLTIDGEDAEKVIKQIEGLSPVYDVDAVIGVAFEEGVKIPEAIHILQDELDGM